MNKDTIQREVAEIFLFTENRVGGFLQRRVPRFRYQLT